jgi:hypothetical protein
MTQPDATHRPMPSRQGKRPEDTPAGCRARASADLCRAGELAGALPKARFEHSAAAWTARAELLERLEAKHSARMRGERP